MLEPQIITKTIKTVVAGQVVSLGEVEVEDPSLVLSTYEVEVSRNKSMTVELFYLGEGTITVTNPNPTALSATYDSVTRTIALVNNLSEEDSDSDVDVNLTVSLSRPGNCVTESVTLTVHCLIELDPQLTLGAKKIDDTHYEAHGSYEWYGPPYITVEATHLGNGELTVTGCENDRSVTWDTTTKTLKFNDSFGGTITFSLAVDPPYAASTVYLNIYWHGVV